MIARVAALLALAAATLYALYVAVFVPLRCARKASVGAVTLVMGGSAVRVRQSLRGCECVTAREAHIDFILGGVDAARGDDRAAIDEYRRALTIERRPEIYYGLGMAQLGTDRAAAVDNLVRACAFDPTRLTSIPDGDVRDEVERRVRARYGDDWLR